ncbi:MAG: MFS transporter [Agarilytica sp.]
MPYWRLSSVYFFYFSVVGALSPYWGIYLQSLGFQPQQIGIIFSVPMITKLIAPNVWSWLSDRSGQRMLVMRLGALGACCFFVGIFIRNDYAGLILFTALYSVFWNAVLPQFEAVTLSFLGDRAEHYSKVRLWGSVGFICTVVALGWVFEHLAIAWLPVFVLIFLVGIFIFSCALPALASQSLESKRGDFVKTLLSNRVYLFFLALLFLQLSHGVYYVFYSIYLEAHGYAKFSIGLLWAIGVVSEIVIFLYVPQLFKRFSLFRLLSFSFLMTAVRWFVIGAFPENVPLIMLAQLVHALSFGVVHAVAIQFIKSRFSDASQGQAQAFYSAASFGGGAALGAYLSGLLWDISPQLTFNLAAMSALCAWGLCVVFLRKRIDDSRPR